MQITSLGDSALIVRVREDFRDAPEKTLDEVLSAMHRIAEARISGVIECASAYTTVAVFFDPVEIIKKGAKADEVIAWLSEKIREALRSHHHFLRDKMETRLVEIPVCFDLEFALDLKQVASRARRTTDEVIDLYCAGDYRVGCIGFRPGFPFLTGLPKNLATPRRATPRKEIPAGSVAIGNDQTGIYPLRSPGGWNLIGRTPLQLFDPKKEQPTLLRAGDRVRFRAITQKQFETMTHQALQQ
jgi:inhibitor of KinA